MHNRVMATNIERMREAAKRRLRVVKLRDINGWTFEKIGKEYGVTRQRVFKMYKMVKNGTAPRIP